jgi:large subunit ribosomal protein L31
MKQSIHPEYRDVIFKDISTEFAFMTRSTVQTKDTIQWEDGKEYPLVKVEISSDSHPFYTGKQRMLDTEGRVERFMKKYGMKNKSKEEEVEEEK